MLFVGTIRENLLYGNADASDERLDEVAADAHADIFIRDLAKDTVNSSASGASL